ncbi:MAG: DNA polymerase III subunit delta [Gemmatimonadales bacterium]
MASRGYDTLLRSLKKGELAPVYYLHGPEDILKDEAVTAIVELALDPGLRDFNFDQRSAAQLDPEAVFTLCTTLPMMAERRVVVLRDLEGWKRKPKVRAAFLQYLERPAAETVVILVQSSGEESEDKEIARGSWSVACEPLPPDRVLKWLQRRAGALGVELGEDAAHHLIRAVGGDLGALAAELQKFSALPAGDSLTVERVGELVGVRHGETVFDWRDAVLDGDTGRAVTLLGPLLDQSGSSGVKLVTLLGTTFIGVGIARSHYDRRLRGRALDDAVFEIIKRNRVFGLLSWSEEKGRWIRWAERWPGGRIREALRAAQAADKSLKGTTISDEKGILTDLVLTVRPRRATAAAGMSLVGVLLALIFLAAAPLRAQTDPRLVEAVRSAQEGRGDSARAAVRQLLAATQPTDTLYPQIVYTQAMVANSAAEMRRHLQQVAVEYGSSSWGDDALLRLVQMDYATRNFQSAARNLERLRLDYPLTSLLPQAAYWAGRTYFDLGNQGIACRWLADGIARAEDNLELQNQLNFLYQRCDLGADSAPAGTAARADSQVDSAAAAGPPKDTAPPAPAPDSTKRIAAFRVQVAAVATAGAADDVAEKVDAMNLPSVIVREKGLYKVRAGAFASRAEAQAAVGKIRATLGGSPFVVAEP